MGINMKQSTRYFYIIFGSLCVLLGVIGIIVPILPTTPFLLLAAYFFAKSSKRFLNWLLTNRLFGRYIDNYRSGRGIPLLQKVLTITSLWLTIGVSALFFVESWWVRGLLLVIALGVSIHLLRVKTYKEGVLHQPSLGHLEIENE